MPSAIHINDLLARCILGISDEERREKQDVLISIVIMADLSAASAADNFAQTLDYRALKKKVLAFVEGSQFYLLEALTERVADLCLQEPLADEVRVKIEKPSALRFARSVAIEVVKTRP